MTKYILSVLWLCVFCVIGRPFINVPDTSSTLSVEQISSPKHPFWKDAAVVYGMTEYTKVVAPKWNTSIALIASKKHLYLQIRGKMEYGTKPRANETRRDGSVYHDDCMEVAISLPGTLNEKYYQFTVNPANVIYDAYCTDINWNGTETTAVCVENELWSVTYCLPFADFGFKTRPDTLNFNVARTNHSPQSEQTVLARTSPSLFFGNMNEAFLLHFGDELPTCAIEYIQQENGNIVRAKALTLPEEKFADFTVTIFNSKGERIKSISEQVRFDSLQSDIQIPVLPDGKYSFQFQMTQPREFIMPAYYGGGREPNPALEEGQPPAIYNSYSWPVNVDNAPKLTTEFKLNVEATQLQLTIMPSGIAIDENSEYVLSILDTQKHFISKIGTAHCNGQKQILLFPLVKLPERTRYLLKAEILSNGKSLIAKEIPFATPPEIVWNNWRIASPDAPDVNKVPAPWTPVTLQGNTAFCWGRSIQFSTQSPAPEQIISKGTPLLQAPAKLVTMPQVKWTMTKAERLNPSCARVDYSGLTENGDKLTAFCELYFDGVIRTDVTLPPNVSFEKMYLELPYKKDVARYVHQGPGQFGGMFNIRLCIKPEQYPAIPNYMLLNDSVGLGWFDAMPFDWPLASPQKAIVMEPEKESTTLRINYVDTAKSYAKARRFSWGLQAFPARPMPEKEVAMRMSYAVKYGDEHKTGWLSTVDYQAKNNIVLEQGALEFKFKLPKTKQDEQLLKISHGEADTVIIKIDKAGKIIANDVQYWVEKWKLTSTTAITANVWHALGLNWGDNTIQLWLDGAMLAQCEQPALMRIFPTNIAAGGKHATIDELRISSKPRKYFSMDTPVVDDITLLCDCYDKQDYVNGRKATIPLKISPDAEAGYILPDTELVPGIKSMAVGPLTKPEKSVIQAYAALGFQALCYHASQYTDEAFSGLYIKNEKALKSSMDAIHAAGMKAIFYVANGLSNFDRSWDARADQWLIEPRGVPFIQSWIPDEKGYQACPRSGYIDYFLYRVGKLFDDYGADGIFLDGRMESQCSNALHGCGTENFDGETVPERNVWAGRINSWHLYNVVQRRKGYCEQHKSGNWNIPDCFFWNGVWEGEQLMGVSLNGRKRLDVCPLESFRGEINGIPFGMPSRNTAYSYAPLTPIENCTMSFVHGTTWTMTYRLEEGMVVSPYWLVQEKFGANKHNFRPYWEPIPPAESTPCDLVKVSAHVKKGEALIMVANFNEDKPAIAGSVKLNLQALGFMRPALKNAFSEKSVPIATDGTFPISIKSFRQDWFILEEAK